MMNSQIYGRGIAMKKLFALTLALALVCLLFSSCGGDSESPATTLPETTSDTSTSEESATLPDDADEAADAIEDLTGLSDDEIAAVLTAGGVLGAWDGNYDNLSDEQRRALAKAYDMTDEDLELWIDLMDGDGIADYVDEEGNTVQMGGNWPDNELASKIPAPDGKYTIFTSIVEDGTLSMTLNEMTAKSCKDYAKKLKAAGYDNNAEEMDAYGVYSFSADNGKYEVDLNFAMSLAAIEVSPLG